MSRTWADYEAGDAGGWVMCCDQCGNRSDVRPGHDDLPLEEFQDAGWFIAKLYGDICPRCLAQGAVTGVEAFRRTEDVTS